ncbi:hypothetical protein PKO51_06505 [Yokenella regensburgei]|uniref:hypothetical protein n=1 Tax=Yokenella regensburgei TaxID=158877 RepID=UPI0027D98508|nr:hypothetical protein [Yokenella regensburgei]MDQ4429026.1 hypothetical protein [Yokenella regensburgei]
MICARPKKVGLCEWCISASRSGKRPHIFVDGVCEFEVVGIQAILEEKGYLVSRFAQETPKESDLLIVALSAPLQLGWWRHLDALMALMRDVGCRMVVLVPDALHDAVSQLTSCEVISGDGHIDELCLALLQVVHQWERRGIPGRKYQLRYLSPRQREVIAGLRSRGGQEERVKYTHRYLALQRLRFSNALQYHRFMAGNQETDKNPLLQELRVKG